MRKNGVLNKLFLTFKEVIFIKSEFPAYTPVFDTRYIYLGSQNNNPFYLFNNKLDYILAY